MQARLQEIRDRYNFITNNPDMVNNRVVYPTMRKITDDVGFLLDALEQLEFEKAQENKRNRLLVKELQQSRDKERVLRDVLKSSKQTALNCVSKVRYGLGAGGHGSGMITEVEVGGVVLDCVQECIDESLDEALKEDKP